MTCAGTNEDRPGYGHGCLGRNGGFAIYLTGLPAQIAETVVFSPYCHPG
jgi:hypothetical protein